MENGDEQADVDFCFITLAQAARLIPGREPGRKISIDSIWRWCIRGVRGVRLRSVLIGGRRFTTRQWLLEFIETRSRLSEAEPLTVQLPRTVRQRNKASADASRELRALWRTGRRRK